MPNTTPPAPEEKNETLESLMAGMKRLTRECKRLEVRLSEACDERDAIRERIHAMTAKGGTCP